MKDQKKFPYGRFPTSLVDAWGFPTAKPPTDTPKQTVRTLYFAYGSNLDWFQMKRRCPDAKFSSTARLHGWKLTFGGHSGWWGGAVATLKEHPKGTVEGIIYSITDSDLLRLDAYEGAPSAYIAKRVTVADGLNQDRKCRTYLLRDPIKSGPPGPKYIAQVQQAYMDFGFDLRRLYRAAMEAV
jgi:hypothetical protein